jgi:hypothetical protein
MLLSGVISNKQNCAAGRKRRQHTTPAPAEDEKTKNTTYLAYTER